MGGVTTKCLLILGRLSNVEVALSYSSRIFPLLLRRTIWKMTFLPRRQLILIRIVFCSLSESACGNLLGTGSGEVDGFLLSSCLMMEHSEDGSCPLF